MTNFFSASLILKQWPLIFVSVDVVDLVTHFLFIYSDLLVTFCSLMGFLHQSLKHRRCSRRNYLVVYRINI